MPDIDQDQLSDQQDQQITGDDLSELHGIALQLQSAGDPRAQKLWDFIAEQSGGADPNAAPSGVRLLPAQNDATQPAMRPETAQFLNDLSGIGTGAFLDMRQADTPEYQDWRDGNFIANDSGNYVSREGQAYTDDELERMHGVLSRQAGNPLVSRLFAGPKTPVADYMAWRNQNFDGTPGGVWEDEDGTLYTEESLQKMFGDKSSAQQQLLAQATGPVSPSSATQSQQPQTPAQPEHGEGSKANLAKRAEIARRALGYDASTHWAFDTDRSEVGFGPKTNKCNVFVYDLAKEAGAEAQVAGRKKWPMPVAAEWSNRKFKIPNWRALGPDETPQAGDVAAYPIPEHAPGQAPFTGHSGIMVTDANGKLGSMSAHDDEVGPIDYDQFLHEASERQATVVFRRYTGD